MKVLKRENMEYKISQLVSLTNVPKSTILYYIREGMLPEAKKIKSNVHRYSDEHLELIKYIKYMKTNIGSSNDAIKTALQNKNRSFSTSFTMIEPLMNTLSLVSKDEQYFTKEDFTKIAQWIGGENVKYYLQNFRAEKTIDPAFEKVQPFGLG